MSHHQMLCGQLKIALVCFRGVRGEVDVMGVMSSWTFDHQG